MNRPLALKALGVTLTSCDGAGSVEVHVPRAELKGRVLDGVPLRSPEGSEIRGVERGLINSWSVMENEV